MSPWKVILATMVIFGCGVVTGALVMRTAIVQPPGRFREGPPGGPRGNGPFRPGQLQNQDFLHQMDIQLKLTTEQHARIAKIMDDSQERSSKLWDEIGPKMQQELKRTRDDITNELTPDQRKQFVEMLPQRRRPDGMGPRGGEPFRQRTNHFSTNGSDFRDGPTPPPPGTAPPPGPGSPDRSL